MSISSIAGMQRVQAAGKPPTPIDPGLFKAAAEKPVDALVFFKASRSGETASAMGALDAAEAMNRGPDRKSLVVDSLKTINRTSAGSMRTTLDELQSSGAVAGVDQLWSMNAVRLRGASAGALEQLAGSNVQAIVPDEIVAYPIMPEGLAAATKGAAQAGGVAEAKASTPAKAATAAPTAADDVWMGWGVDKMNAPAAWKQGITGAGITVASLDTGVETDHPGLKANYRGTKPDGSQDHNHNWINVVEKMTPDSYPIDDNGHGTHTIGNTLGHDKNHLIGVAPDATMIAGRGLGNAGGSLFGLLNAMEWMLAPTDLSGKNPRPDLAPDIVTNSWGGPGVSNPFLWMGLRNWRRAGIVPVFAAGNTGGRDGAAPGTIASPGLYGETLTVGASDKNDQRALFSNRGPSNFANDVKPEVVAPGVKTYSSLPGGRFADTFKLDDGREVPASGTSMATPHVAGAIALYLQANPNATFDEIRTALTATATHPEAPDNDTGYGRVQVDKLIGKIDKDAKLTDPKRVAELMDQVSRAKVFGEQTPAA